MSTPPHRPYRARARGRCPVPGHPKFLHPLTGTSGALLQATARRLGDLLGAAEWTLVVTGVAHVADVSRQCRAYRATNILVEPSPRDSVRGDRAGRGGHRPPRPEGRDGGVRRRSRWSATGRRSTSVCGRRRSGARHGLLMTIGITPTLPETGYGYVRRAASRSATARCGGRRVHREAAPRRGRGYVESGEYLWNAGMFVWRVDVFLAELARQQPALHEGLARIAADVGPASREEMLGEVWPTLPRISVDYAVMEGAATAGRVGTVSRATSAGTTSATSTRSASVLACRHGRQRGHGGRGGHRS